MNFQQLSYARAVQQYSSFARAAAHCHVTQSTLSNGIAQLEQELGGVLFTRTTRHVSLSPFGARVLPLVLDVLNAKTSLLAEAKQALAPSLNLMRLGVSPLIGASFLSTLSKTFTATKDKIEFVYREKNLAELLKMLTDGQLDYVIGPGEPAANFGREFGTELLWAEDLALVSSAGVATKGDSLKLKDAAKETLVMVPDTCGLSTVVRNTFRRARVAIKEYDGEANSYDALQEWARLGIGSAVLPVSKIAAGTDHATLVERGGKPARICYYLIWRLQQKDQTLHTAFISHAKRIGPALLGGSTNKRG